MVPSIGHYRGALGLLTYVDSVAVEQLLGHNREGSCHDGNGTRTRQHLAFGHSGNLLGTIEQYLDTYGE